jgi:hypothetical protein
MLAMMGGNTSFVAVLTQAERIKLAADGASLVQSDKTLTDHALSKVTGKECKIFNVLSKESVCAEKTPVIAADSDALPKEVATGAASADPAALPTEVATVTPAHSDALPKEIAASAVPADSDALPKVVAAAVTPEKSVALPKEIAASAAPAESHTYATIAPSRSFEFSREQASGD